MFVASIITALTFTPPAGDSVHVRICDWSAIEIGRQQAVWYERSNGKYYVQPRAFIALYPFPDPLWRVRDAITVSMSDRLDLRIETGLFLWQPQVGGAFWIREMVYTRHQVAVPLLRFVPPMDD